MWCPSCGAEYEPGFSACADCGVALTAEPAGAPVDQPAPPRAVSSLDPELANIRTAFLGRFNQLEIPIVMQMLEANGIFATTKLPHTEPDHEQYLFVGSGATQVIVDAARIDDARRLVREELPHIERELQSGLADAAGEHEPT